MSVDNGEWVFPKNISLRDYFAAKAMESLLKTMTRKDTVELISQAAYVVADAMLEARK